MVSTNKKYCSCGLLVRQENTRWCDECIEMNNKFESVIKYGKVIKQNERIITKAYIIKEGDKIDIDFGEE